MLNSMTAFASVTDVGDKGCFSWEIRGVNHRYLEVSVRLPEWLRGCESAVREKISQVLRRGKVEVCLKWQAPASAPDAFALNQQVVTALAATIAQAAAHFPQATVSMTDILQWPGVLENATEDCAQWQPALLASLTSALQTLCQARQLEGSGIAEFLRQRCREIHQQVDNIALRLPECQRKFRQKISERFAELQISLDQERLEQEVLWLVQKSDVAEELQRLQSHLQQVETCLNKGGVVGRQLDFLMQELNREANTLSSKSIDVHLTQAAVAIKVAIEQMREQVQNIE